MKKIAYIFCYGSFILSALSTFLQIAMSQEEILTANILGGILVIIISLSSSIFLFYIDTNKNKNLIYLLLINFLILSISFIIECICIRFNLLNYKRVLEPNLRFRFMGHSTILYIPTFFISLFGIVLFYKGKK